MHEYVREWVERYQGGKRGFREETRDNYRRMLDKYALRYFNPKLKLCELTPLQRLSGSSWNFDGDPRG